MAGNRWIVADLGDGVTRLFDTFRKDWAQPHTAELPIEMVRARMVADRHARADRDTGVAICYFIGGIDGPVKIGHSVDLPRRLSALRASSPVPLDVLATTSGGSERESAYHFQFAEHRLHGEWFERAPAIEAEIAALNDTQSPRVPAQTSNLFERRR